MHIPIPASSCGGGLRRPKTEIKKSVKMTNVFVVSWVLDLDRSMAAVSCLNWIILHPQSSACIPLTVWLGHGHKFPLCFPTFWWQVVKGQSAQLRDFSEFPGEIMGNSLPAVWTNPPPLNIPSIFPAITNHFGDFPAEYQRLGLISYPHLKGLENLRLAPGLCS